jgi:hypothetical protein
MMRDSFRCMASRIASKQKVRTYYPKFHNPKVYDDDDFIKVRYYAPRSEVFAKLEDIGVRLPKGTTMEWGVFGGADASFFDRNGEPIGHLFDEPG